jgi:DNA helicase-2/ATP-dependent DNA helicase PcrA
VTANPIHAITGDEIAWASKLMGLGPHGFAAIDGDDSRMHAICNLETCDFEACPGSGKTTLLVAKLAILASRWPHRQRGICVLSHTNAARDEINQRLSANAASASLIRYPHFIGTIHGFVNEYLAIPWLRSKGNPVRLIDTSVALKRRHAKLDWKWRAAMERRFLDTYALQYDRPDYSGKGKGKLSRDTELCRAMEAAARAGSEEGYLCFDEMFVWANELLDLHPEVATNLRTRFPLIFVDEAQDNSELQSVMLHRVFLEGEEPCIRQRFGDSNQAIYEHADAEGAQTDRFPSATLHNLPRSYRFPQSLADIARGLGVVPQALVGAGPTRSRVNCAAQPPIVFLFDEATVREVLPRYGEHLLATFSASDLAAGVFTAIAGVHDLDEGRTDQIPRAMGHYAPLYDSTIARPESVPATFLGFIAKAEHAVRQSGNTQALVNALASALMRLSELAGALPHGAAQSRRSPHRNLLEVLNSGVAKSAYGELLEMTLATAGSLTTEMWAEALPRIFLIARQLAGAGALNKQADEFLAFPGLAPSGTEDQEAALARRTFFSYSRHDANVNIRLGSIHSAKGETHTATLVLDSYFHKHHLSELKPWLLGERQGGMKSKPKGKLVPEGPRMLGRMKLHYVAMTRPSHLLCLAMRKDSFADGELEQLKERGWLTVDCCA